MRKRKIILTFLIALLSITSHGQIFSVDIVIVNKEQNDEWLNHLGTLDRGGQIELIHKRLLADTITYVRQFGDRIVFKPLADSVKISSYCRLLLIIDGQPVYIKNSTETKRIKNLISILTSDNIKKVEILKDDKAAALYGSQGLCGLILISTSDKRTKRKIERIGI